MSRLPRRLAISGVIVGMGLLLLLQWRAYKAQSATEIALRRLLELREGATEPGRDGPPLLSGPANAALNAFSQAQLRVIVREELQRALRSADRAAVGDSAVIEPGAAAPPPGNAVAYEQAQHLIDDAIAAHLWNDKQAAEFRNLRASLTPDQLQAINRKIFPAVNKQQLRLETVGPPF